MTNYAGSRGTVEQRFWSKVEKNGPLCLIRGVPGHCWQWKAHRNAAGYGEFRVCGQIRTKSHRWAYEQLIGPIPEGLQLDHLCRNTSCCNPAHLEPVTGLENVRRHFALMTHCRLGHPLSGDNLRLQHGRRRCRTCQRASNRASYSRQAELVVAA